ncbi:uncharacterized protein MYCFIDRAFT_216598 [Pseudocercospora fijiensis CIRAD86]|uniref:N-acetyltransferase domain-containing protein n=1 Tax=Pseudocercospora fijiensis (strain CIRAD86) TaxID=383855 RepID=M3A1N7_PSEFD|nr:uncharacterized protein MYCFIDRAFT_216598 [Pseudocercospora fijiensis CIRAD86]EME78281.1 hypothetical protein MYCFIDRAFT_216598 [Pseudocercospora fijiensis CIRAD86]
MAISRFINRLYYHRDPYLPRLHDSSSDYITPLRLAPPREESTRVQLQKQRIYEYNSKVLVDPSAIPGFKTSAAFFGSLRTNLRLHASPPPSPISTPNSMRGSATSLPPPSPLSGPVDSVMDTDHTDAVTPEDPLAGVPELSSYLATDDFERMEALKLVADSIAQQRNAANRALIFHPLNMAVMIGVLAFVGRWLTEKGYDWWMVGSTVLGILMAGLAACRIWSQEYIIRAEDINWAWAGDADFLVTKFGDEVIGTVLIEWVSGESRTKKRKAWRGLIKAWTVKLKYRGKGVGSGLLEDAVKEAKKKGAESLEFDDDHANSKRVLPRMYNGAFDRREAKAREQLQDLMDTSPSRKRK